MTKSELRKARKESNRNGLKLTGELRIDDRDDSNIEFTESSRGRNALDKWARNNYEHDDQQQ